ncbi:hypothetical protein WDU94_005489 [Cyamophila willieti]
MMVNEEKSKVVVFRRGGRLAQTDTFLYNNRSLEVSSEYVYLGVKLSSHGVFHKASLQAISKGKMAVSSVKNILVNSRMTSQESRIKLYQSIVCATLLYGAEIWGSRYGDVIEVAQSQFFKSVFCLPRSTPHYMIRIEFGVVKLAYFILKQMLGWWFKLLSMSVERYPRICYNQLVVTDQLARNIEKYNWTSLLKKKLVQLGYADIWEAQSPELLKDKMDEILSTYKTQLTQEDYRRLEGSSYCTFYKELKPFTSNYLLELGPIDRVRITAQIRLSGSLHVKFYVNRTSFQWDANELCSICNLQEKEDLEHFLSRCPLYTAPRQKFISNLIQRSALIDLFKNPTKSEVNNVYFYVVSALKLRSFLRNE